MEQSTAEVQKQPEESQPQQTQTEPPKQDGTVESAAQALAGLLDDEGSLKQDSPEPEPQGQPEQAQAEPAKDAPEPVEETKGPEPITLKIGEKEFSIPIKDIPEELRDVVKDGLLMRADYTRKTQEVAEGRKFVEGKVAEVGQAFQAMQAMPQQFAALTAIDAQLQQFAQADWQRIESEDPLGAIQAKQRLQDLQMQRGQLLGHMQQTHQQFTAYQQKQIQERVQAALPEVKKAIPDFGPEKARALKDLGKSIGYTDAQLASLYDAPPLIALNALYELNKLKAQQKETQSKVEKLPQKAVKSGVSQTPGTGPTLNQSAMQRLQRSGKVEDAAAAIKSLLG